MCTTTDDIEQTQEPRDINVLLSLETYQGMTDAEIEAIITYKVTQGISSRETLAKITAIVETEARIIENNKVSAAAAQGMLQSLLEMEFPTVPLMEPKTFTPRGMEV